jgi:hypothetical protein
MMIALIVLLAVLQAGQKPPAPDEWAAAERAIVRLPPSAFKTLPPEVRADLERRQCTIPQPDQELDEPPPYNVITGRFTSARSSDIAVLCSKDGASAILVYRGRSTADVAELASSKDSGWLQTGGPKKRIEFSRAIGVATPARIRQSHRNWGGPTPPSPLDHDGIDDVFVNKASIIRYWFGGRWLELSGSD